MSHRFTISLPDDAYSLLEEDAKRNCRTLSEELTYMLRTHKGRYSTPASVVSTPTSFIKPVLPENPEGSPTLTNDTTAYYKKRKETII